MSQKVDAIVLGLGAAGSAALYQLAKRGSSVIGIDQFDPPHTMGSSHGDSRITRQAIGEGAHYTPLSLRSYEIFRDIEKQTGESLLVETGGLMISSEVRTGINHVKEFFENTLAAARRFDIRHEILDASDIRKRFPGFDVRDNEQAYYEFEAGYLRPESCIRTQLQLAKSHGATIISNDRAIKYSANSNCVTVTTDGGEFTADQLVITAGPWIPDLVPAEMKSLFEVHRQVLYWFDVSENYQLFQSEKFPIFIWEVQGGSQAIYGFPAIGGKSGGMKIATEDYNQVVTPETVNRQVSENEIEMMYECQVKPFLPKVGKECLKTVVCMYTNTADSGFVIDRLPNSPNVIICSPCSGHGFKHSAAVGECVAELVRENKTSIGIDALKLSRRSLVKI